MLTRILSRLIEIITGDEPLPPGTSPWRLLLTAFAVGAIVYLLLVLALGLA